MSSKKMKNIPAKSSPLMTAVKAAMLGLSLYFSCAMPLLSGAGLIYNRESYGERLTAVGIFLVISALFMTVGAFLSLIRRNLADILSVILSVSGLTTCLVMLSRLIAHADRSGWTDKYSLMPISSMYRSRILPCIIPVALSVTIAVIQLCSYELSRQRRDKKALRASGKKSTSVIDSR